MHPYSFVVRTPRISRDKLIEIRNRFEEKVFRLQSKFRPGQQPHFSLIIEPINTYKYRIVLRMSMRSSQIVKKTVSDDVIAGFEDAYTDFKENILQLVSWHARMLRKRKALRYTQMGLGYLSR